MSVVDAFRNNVKLKKPGAAIVWTAEMALEYKKCMEDPVYFVRNYMKIVNVDLGLINFDLYDYQEDLLETYTNERRVVVLSSRQSGKSITSIGFFLHYTLFNDHKRIAILANKGESARGLLARYQLAYEHLPLFLQQGIIEWNKGNIMLENGSSIVAGSTTSSAVRSQSINILFLDEYAFIEPRLAEEFFRSVYPTISSGDTTKIIVVSTANGMNQFYKLYHDADEKINNYCCKRVDWWQVPGRDEAWKEETIKATSEEQFAQEFGNEFIGSVGTLISPATLRNMTFDQPQHSDENGLKIYDAPIRGHVYALIADTAEGLELDDSAISVLDVTALPYKQVAVYRNGKVDPHQFPDIIRQLGMKYNEAHVLIELNNQGAIVADIMYQELEYDNVLMTASKGRAGQVLGSGFGKNTQYGVKTSVQVKRIGCSVLKTLIENEQLIIRDFDTVSQLTSFIRKKNSYEAEEGHKDDMVATLFLFAWMTNQQYFKDDLLHNLRDKLPTDRLEQIEQTLTPIGIINTNDVMENDDPMLQNGAVWNF